MWTVFSEKGGMGVVVAATHEQLEQRVALKFLLRRDGRDMPDPGRDDVSVTIRRRSRR